MLSFPPFQLDIENQRLWKSGEETHVRRKPFAILRYLVQHPQRLVAQRELVDAVWGGKFAMSESLLRTHLSDLRQVLGEGVIETVTGRGYRFVPELKRLDLEARRADAGTATTGTGNSVLVGRDAELDLLRSALLSARDRRRTTVFVSGEAGTGKTTLVDAFLERATVPALVGWGTCVEQYGSGEPYLPVLDAVSALCRGRGGDHVIDVFTRHAPAWLVQLPGVVRPDRHDDLRRRAAGATPAGTVCELADALEVLSVDSSVVLVFDDLQWTDPSTAKLIAFLSGRREPARLLIVGTYRPEETPRGHPLTRVMGELIAHRRAFSIALDGLSSRGVDVYLSERYPGHEFPAELARSLERSTRGNPLFLTTLVDDLEREGIIRERMGQWELSTNVSEVAARRLDSIRCLITRTRHPPTLSS